MSDTKKKKKNSTFYIDTDIPERLQKKAKKIKGMSANKLANEYLNKGLEND